MDVSSPVAVPPLAPVAASARPTAAPTTRGTAKIAGAFGALGIVYGDIGTSPLYALKETVKAAAGTGSLQPQAVLGSVSLILWALILIVALKYALLILRADNRGEGGIMAMLALLGARHAPPRSWRGLLLVLGLVGAALLYGDGAYDYSTAGAWSGLVVGGYGNTAIAGPGSWAYDYGSANYVQAG